MTITKRMIIIEGEAVAPVNNGKVDASLKPDGENGYLIQPIVDILTKIANRERRVAEMTGDKFDSELMVVADQHHALPPADRGALLLRPGRLLELPAGRAEERRVAPDSRRADGGRSPLGTGDRAHAGRRSVELPVLAARNLRALGQRAAPVDGSDLSPIRLIFRHEIRALVAAALASLFLLLGAAAAWPPRPAPTTAAVKPAWSCPTWARCPSWACRATACCWAGSWSAWPAWCSA